GNQRGARLAQKEKNHQHHQYNGDEKRQFDIVDGGANGGGAVESDDKMDVAGNGRLERRQGGANAIDGVDDVGLGLLENDDDDGRFAIGKSGGANVLDGILDGGDVFEADGGAVVIADDERFVVVGFEQLVVGDDVSGGLAVGKLALGEVRVGAGEDVADVLHAEAAMAELNGIDVHAHGGKGAAADGDLANAVHLREALLHDGGGGIIHLAAAEDLRGQRDDHDRRIGRVDLAPGWVHRKVGRKVTAGGVDGGLDVARGAVDVAIEVKLEGDASRAEITLGRHFIDAGDVAQLAFERRGDGGSHGFGRGAGQARGDGNAWE